MGKRFLHSIVTPNTDSVASADIVPFDLPVNPVSMLLLHLEVTNTSPAAIGTYSAIDDLIRRVTNINVKLQGENIISGSLYDLMMLNMIYHRAYPGMYRAVRTNGAIRGVVIPLCFGRYPYDPDWALPATTRGKSRFELTAGANPASLSDMNFSLEAVELIEASPANWLKYTTLSRNSVAGQFDQALPIGNPLLGMLLFDTGLFANTTALKSWGVVKLLADNVEQYYPASDIEVIAGMLPMQMAAQPALFLNHVHQINDGAALSVSDDAEEPASSGTRGYAYLDFDPTRDGTYELETQGLSTLTLRGAGDEASAVRVLTVEHVKAR